MDEGIETKFLNNKTGWIVGGLGIPLAAILTWVFSAGQLSYITNQNATKIGDQENRIRILENNWTRVDTQYGQIQRELSEVKAQKQAQGR